MKKIKYISYYDVDNLEENRSYVLSSSNKLSYIASVIEALGHNIDIISCSGSLNKNIYKNKKIKISDNTSLLLPYTIGNGNKARRVVDRFLIRLQLLNNLIFKTKKSDTVIVYHSLGYMKTINFIKLVKKFKLILEVEEIYGDVLNNSIISNKELKYTQIADGYIFPTEFLNAKINKQNKPYAIVEGTYQVEEDLGCEFNDGKNHCVYAGTFDPRKGGAAAAAAAAEFLPESYHLHIIGFGSDRDKQNLLNTIEVIRSKTKCTITYDGLLSGKDYLEFLQSCQIGLSLQNPKAKFNDTSFPSKVLSYMANGLRVVSIKIPVLESSGIGDLLYYYEEDTPKAIAKAICSVNLKDGYESRNRISQLNAKFQVDIEKLLKGDL